MASIAKLSRNITKPWTVRWRDGAGNSRQRAFATKREATDYKIRMEHDTREGYFIDPREASVPFAAYAAGIVAGMAASEGTLGAYRGILRTWIEPWAGNRSLAQIANDREGFTALVNRTMVDKSGKLLSYNRRGSARTIVLAVLAEAISAGRLQSHRLNGIKLVRSDEIVERKDFVFPSYRDISSLAATINGACVSTWLMRGAGLRVREALAVQKSDFRDNGTVLRVARQSSVNGDKSVPLKHRRAGQFRDVPVPSWLWAIVKKLPDGVLAKPANGNPYLSYSVVYKRFVKAAGELGIPEGFSPHSLRHAYATALLSAGVPVTNCAAWLGHQDSSVTSRIYAHVIPSDLGRARAVLDGEFEAWKAA